MNVRFSGVVEAHGFVELFVDGQIVSDEIGLFVVLPTELPAHHREAWNAPSFHIFGKVDEEERKAVDRVEVGCGVVDNVTEIFDP